MIKSLNKRKAIAEMIYNQYVALTEEEKTLHEDEVGAAFKGYELAIKDVCEFIKNNLTKYHKYGVFHTGLLIDDLKKLIER